MLFIFVFSLPLGWRCVPCFLPMELILLYLTAIPRQLWMLRQQKNFKISFHVCSVFCLISFYCHSQIPNAMSDIEVRANWGVINKSTAVFEMRSKCSMFPLKFLGKWNAWEGEKRTILPVPSCHFLCLYCYRIALDLNRWVRNCSNKKIITWCLHILKIEVPVAWKLKVTLVNSKCVLSVYPWHKPLGWKSCRYRKTNKFDIVEERHLHRLLLLTFQISLNQLNLRAINC